MFLILFSKLWIGKTNYKKEENFAKYFLNEFTSNNTKIIIRLPFNSNETTFARSKFHYQCFQIVIKLFTQ